MKTIKFVGASLLALPLFANAQACDSTEQLTPISQIQGVNAESPLQGQVVTVRGVVTANWSNEGGLEGFFIQSLTDQQDDAPNSSEGLFVNYHAAQDLDVGDIVDVVGEVDEDDELTQLEDIESFYECGTTEVPAPVAVSLPFASHAQAEAHEGMLITLSGDQALTVSGNYGLAPYGNFDISSGRLWTPTQVAKPGEAANAVANSNALNRVSIDDNSNQTPDELPHQQLFQGPNHSLRSGTTVRPVTGIFSQREDHYLLQPTQAPELLAAAKITPIYPKQGNDIRIASYNVLNYFNGDGVGGEFPTPRGAKNPEQLVRQQQKIVAALDLMDADIIGLMEVENDGYGPESAIQQLVAALNERQSTQYAIAQPRSERIGGDKISVGLIYDKARFSPQSHAVTLEKGPFVWGSRVPMAQVFDIKGSDQEVTVIVNHFKSKGSCPDDGPNANQNDGQACWNVKRLESAQALVEWVAAEDFPNSVLLGDFNAYFYEDPIRYIGSHGFTNLGKDDDYSYVYDSQAGTLDHVFVANELASKVSSVQHINFNADEPSIYDYRDDRYYKSGPFRSSDHDPLVFDLSLTDD